MKKNLGFTLVELLVVVAIIAILGAIGVSVYQGARQSAMDGRRKSEIKSIADSIEVAKDYNNRVYRYKQTDADKDFPRGVPTDPAGRSYCISLNTNTYSTPSACTSNTTWPATGCPSATDCPAGGGNSNYQPITTVINNATGALATADQKAWTVCAALDRGSQPFCLSSLER